MERKVKTLAIEQKLKLINSFEDALYLWIKENNHQSVLPSNEMTIAKALSLAPNFDIDMEKFKADQSL